MKFIKIIFIALLPVLVVILLEIVITLLLLSFSGLLVGQIYFISNIARIAVAIYIILLLRQSKPQNSLQLRASWRFLFFIISCIAFSLIQLAVGPLFFVSDSILAEGKFSYLKIMSGLLIASWTEEVLFRGWFLGYLIKNNVHVFVSLLISAVVFAFWHYNVMDASSFTAVVLNFFAGLFLGVIFLCTRNIQYSIIAHFLMNATIYVLNALSISSSYSAVVLIVSLLCFIASIIILGFNKNAFLKMK